MSFVDLRTLTMHRRAEMEGRINAFDEKCDRAISDIKKLKTQARGFLSQLNCDPVELKDRFLNVMKKLDEYTYLITDFNLALGQIEDIANSDHTPVQDDSLKPLPPQFSFNTNNLMDALSEPTPSTSCACSNRCPPEKHKRVKVPKQDQALISFSSSTSSESVPSRRSEMASKEVQCLLPDKIDAMNLNETASPPSPDAWSIPAQTLLEVEHEYHGVITVLSGAGFWVITDNGQELTDFMTDITTYCEKNQTSLTIDQARALTYCTYYDDETRFYYRAMVISDDQEENDKVRLFLMDTGEIRNATAAQVQPPAPPPLFTLRPPYARLCHLAGIDLDVYKDKQLMMKYEAFMSNYVETPCTFIVDENESESIGVFALNNGRVINDLLVERGLAVPIDKDPVREGSNYNNNNVPHPSANAAKFPPHTSAEAARYSPHSTTEVPRHSPRQADVTRYQPRTSDLKAAHTSAEVARYSPHTSTEVARYSPHTSAEVARYSPHTSAEVARHSPHTSAEVARYSPRMRATGPPEMIVDSEEEDAPEYDDPVVAVTGYHNRDEEDICKHYKGGPDKTCFKGARCTKKHIMKHPDGWTLDKVEVPGKLASLPLPAPGSWLQVQVTHVAHFDRVYVNLVPDTKQKEEVPEFGVILPPKTLAGLISDMNSAAAKNNYQRLTLSPATGELVAALYPPDGRWYRAMVLTVTRADQSIEVQYVDYGTVIWVKEDQIRVLEPRYCVLPAQAIRCAVAGVHMSSQNSHDWACAKRALADAVQDRTLHAHVIARDFDEVTVDLVDDDDYSIAQLLAAQGVFELREYSVCDDAHVTHALAVP